MTKHLATYLNDHLAGAAFAIELLERLRDTHPEEPLGRFAAEILGEIEEDRAVLQETARRCGSLGSAVKEVTSWLAEKASRLKLRFSGEIELGTFEALEALSLGVLGKRALWRALSVAAPSGDLLRHIDLERLIGRAESQYERLEAFRLEAAKAALAN
jgi:hypothetical protein